MKDEKIILLLILGIILTAIFTYFIITKNNKLENIIKLESQISEEGGVVFEVRPIEFNFENPLKFEIEIDTHSGSLDFDLAKISILEDDYGNKYQPLEWSGEGTGGHHLSGILTFPELNGQTKRIKLIIQDNFLRIFEWDFTF